MAYGGYKQYLALFLYQPMIMDAEAIYESLDINNTFTELIA
jgi:hypothetical protein